MTLAALCHDLGHGPYSHLFDRDFIKNRLGMNWKHEKGSITMFEDLLKKNSITMKSINLEDEDKEFIKALIKGDKKYNINKPDKDKRPNYLFDIVNNEKNSIDVDKFDYFARDCYYSGAKRLFDFSRLMRLSRVMNDEIVYYYKECYLVYDLFHTRYSLHKTLYKHCTVRAIDHMICDVLEKADHYYNFKSAINERNPEKYMRLSDYIFHEIEHSEDDKLAKSKEIIKQIRERKFYKFVDECLIKLKNKENTNGDNIAEIKENTKKDNMAEIKIKEDIMDGIIDCGATLNGANLKREDVIIDWLSFDYGKKDENPVKYVKFYNKNDKEPKKIKKNDVSYLLPIVYKEEIVRIYLRTKGNEKESELEKSFNLIKVAFHSFRKNAKNSGLIDEEEEESSNESEDSNINNGDDNEKKSEIGKKRPSTFNKTSISKKSKK